MTRGEPDKFSVWSILLCLIKVMIQLLICENSVSLSILEWCKIDQIIKKMKEKRNFDKKSKDGVFYSFKPLLGFALL